MVSARSFSVSRALSGEKKAEEKNFFSFSWQKEHSFGRGSEKEEENTAVEGNGREDKNVQTFSQQNVGFSCGKVEHLLAKHIHFKN